jgi:diguanylate cyclase (GGDEF)-like protein/PAS domain S-box-containing protein
MPAPTPRREAPRTVVPPPQHVREAADLISTALVATPTRPPGHASGEVRAVDAQDDASARPPMPALNSEEMFRALVELSPDAVFVIMDGYHVFANARGLALLGGRTLAELQTRPAEQFMHPAGRAASRERMHVLIEERRSLEYVEERIVRLDGTVVDIEAAGSPITVAGRPAALVVVREITARKQAEAALQAARLRFQSAFEHAPTGMAILDAAGRLLDANPALAELLGHRPAELAGEEAWEAVDSPDRAAGQVMFARLVSGEIPVLRGEFRYRRGDGMPGWLSVSAAALAGSDAYVAHLLDITAAKHTERTLTEQATRDPLTGLPNRTLVLDRLRLALQDRRSESRCVAALFVDLDGFKQVNDGLGHAAGDDVLREMGGRLQRAVRPTDTVGRLGGDEFAVVVTGAECADAAVEVARRILAAVSEPLLAAGTTVRLSASVGIAVTAGRDMTAEDLLARADAAMYRAKHAPPPRIAHASPP